MNVVNAHPRGSFTLGQFADEPLVMDIQYGSAQPDYVEYGPTPQYAPAPTVSVPKPSGSPVYSTVGPYGTIDPILTAAYSGNSVSSPGGLQPGPSPRVNVPLSPSSAGMWLSNSSLIGGLPNWLVLGAGVLAVPLLGSLLGGGGRRRR
jgi:hypothetical protein